jgi:hypothetical protein
VRPLDHRLEKVGSTPAGEASFTGQNANLAGDQLRVFFETVPPLRDGANRDWCPDATFVICNYDAVRQLRLEGVLAADCRNT